LAKAALTDANEIIEQRLGGHLDELQTHLNADVLFYCGPIFYGMDDLIRQTIEDVIPKKSKLVVVLETSGGYIEVAQRIADTLRHHYGFVEFIIPNYAMSAGTVLVMSGDAIHMDYYSILGPIDPQVSKGDRPVPALGYLEQYERMIKKSKAGNLSTAEMAFLIEKFDPAELYSYEQARELSISLLKGWLVKYKFKNWVVTETRKKKVTKKMKEDRAVQIARALNDTKKWNSHGRGISMEVFRIDLNLQIEDFGADQKLSEIIRAYYKLLRDYMRKRSFNGIIHTAFSFAGW
jgi:hypothetical protein